MTQVWGFLILGLLVTAIFTRVFFFLKEKNYITENPTDKQLIIIVTPFVVVLLILYYLILV